MKLLEKWKNFQKECPDRWLKTFGNYKCMDKNRKVDYCPRTKYDLCPKFITQER